MKKTMMTAACAALLCFGGSAMASTIYYEASNVAGVGNVNYGYGLGINNPVSASFTASSGTVDENLASFVPGEYTISFALSGFWMDFDGDAVSDFDLPDTSFTSAVYTIPALPSFSGMAGGLTWSVDPYSGGAVSYDFGVTGSVTNSSVNALLAELDQQYSGAMNGVMNADIYWDTLRIELNSAAVSVPEPSTLLVMGIGLLGMVGYKRKRR